jgi:Secretion system C-terminal sorting domain/Putative binding domain, N-terminal
VIFFAGQSNAQGVNGVRSPGFGKNPGDPDYSPEYDCISAINNFADCYCQNAFPFPKFSQLIRGAFDTDRQIAPNGSADVWYYEALGKKIVDKEAGKVIPVVFFNNGQGGTSVENWKLSAGNPAGNTLNPSGYFNCGFSGEEPAGQPYKGLKTSLNYYGGMLGARGVVWHQGESDALTNIIDDVHGGAANTRSFYGTALGQVIARTRLDFDGGLGWAISRVSRITRGSILYEEPNVRLGQEDAKNGKTNTQWGAYFSDDIIDIDRVDGTHFNTNGLKKMAEMYSSTGNYTVGDNGGNILGLTPVGQILAPKIVPTFTNNRTTVTLGVDGTYANYCWVKDDAKMDQCLHTTPTITLPNLDNSPTERWRCYISNSLGTTSISQEAVTPLTRISAFPFLTNIPRFPAPGPRISINSIATDWKLENEPSWASLDVRTGIDGNTQVNVTVTENTSSGPRSGTIQLKSADGTLIENIDISQLGTGGGGGTPSCNNGSSDFSITSAGYDNNSKCVSYQFNASNLSNANWSISGTSHSGSLPQPITQNYGTVNCGVTLPDGNYNFVLTGVSCSGTASKPFTVLGGGTGGGTGADRTDGGTASDDGASNPGSEGEANAFDDQSSTKWLVFSPIGKIAYDFANEDAYAINSYTVTTANDFKERDPKNWTLEYSDNGSNWFGLDSRSNQFENAPRFHTETYGFTNTTAHKHYRLNVTANHGNELLQIAEIQMFGPAGNVTSPPPSGGCSFTDGQFLLNWYDETIQAKFCNGVLYARATWGAWKHPNWLIGAGMNPTTAACFANYNPGCGALRIAAEEPTEELSEKIIAYPNPTTGKIKIAFSLQKAENVWLNLYDTQGKSLDLRDFEGKAGRNEMEYDLQNYPSGAYFVNFQSSEKREVLKVMKVN